MQLRNPSVSVWATVEDVIDSCSALEDSLMLIEGLLVKLRKDYAQNLSNHSEYYEEFRKKPKPPHDLVKYHKNCKTNSELIVNGLDEMLRIFSIPVRNSITDYHKERGFKGEWYWNKKGDKK